MSGPRRTCSSRACSTAAAFHDLDTRANRVYGSVDIASQGHTEDDSKRRYRDLFEYMPIALLQLDPRRLADLFESLRAQGVSDLGAYFDRNPDMLYRMMDLIIVHICSRLPDLPEGPD